MDYGKNTITLTMQAFRDMGEMKKGLFVTARSKTVIFKLNKSTYINGSYNLISIINRIDFEIDEHVPYGIKIFDISTRKIYDTKKFADPYISINGNQPAKLYEGNTFIGYASSCIILVMMKYEEKSEIATEFDFNASTSSSGVESDDIGLIQEQNAEDDLSTSSGVESELSTVPMTIIENQIDEENEALSIYSDDEYYSMKDTLDW
jgi:hypothetical protein